MITHIIPYISREFGGPVIAMAAMVEGLVACQQSVAVYTVQGYGEEQPVASPDSVSLHVFEDMSWGGWRHSAGLWSACHQADIRVIHSHGLWTDVHRCAAVTARRKGVPHVLGPCGMLDSGALRRSRWKKRLSAAWFQSRGLKEASCLLANSEQEYQDIRQYGLCNPVALLPNPVPGPQLSVSVPSSAFAECYGLAIDKRTVLFLGRLHPVKGLERLVDAWGQLSDYHSGWQLVLAGPDEGGYQARIKSQIDRLECSSSIHLIGPLTEATKWDGLWAADVFVMPSDFENFGLSIVEALLVDKPVITTTGTPWSSLVEHGAGWWVEPTVGALQQALVEAMGLSDTQRRAMGQRGHEMASAFAPDRVARQLVLLYGWLLKESDRPDFVRLD